MPYVLQPLVGDLQLCVSDRAMAVLETADLTGCDIDPL